MTDTNDFLPQGYEIPTTSNYMKFQDGLNKFRILGKPIIGFLYWKDKKPIRTKMDELIDTSKLETDPETGEVKLPKHFWAMPVWNYQAQAVQILEITQSSLIKTIKEYARNPKWGNPVDYDILVTKTGTGLLTKYSIDHDPKEPISDLIKEKYKAKPINLNALYVNADPFAPAKDEKQAEVDKEVDDMTKVFDGIKEIREELREKDEDIF